MVALIAFLLIAVSRAAGQVVRDVSFVVLDDNTIRVEYYLDPKVSGQSFHVSLLVSEDLGQNFYQAKSVSGDVGTVSGSGRKSITWNVFADKDVIESEYLSVKVVAREITTFGSFLSNTFFGSRRTRLEINGLSLHGGWRDVDFDNPTFERNVANQSIKTRGWGGGGGGGTKLVLLPFLFDLYFFGQRFDGQESASPIEIMHAGTNVSASFAVLPVIKYLTPYGGLGYQFSSLSLDSTERANTSSLYWTGGAHLNFLLGSDNPFFFQLMVEYEHSMALKERAWKQVVIDGGLVIRFSKKSDRERR
jgi:hypothetical protein